MERRLTVAVVEGVAMVDAACRWGHGPMRSANGGLAWTCPVCGGSEPLR